MPESERKYLHPAKHPIPFDQWPESWKWQYANFRKDLDPPIPEVEAYLYHKGLTENNQIRID